jgi:hypothetical protein
MWDCGVHCKLPSHYISGQTPHSNSDVSKSCEAGTVQCWRDSGKWVGGLSRWGVLQYTAVWGGVAEPAMWFGTASPMPVLTARYALLSRAEQW